MKISVLTIFPEMYEALNSSVIGKALEKELFSVEVYNIRDYSLNKHKKCDDYPFGGGAGMVMTPQPLHDAITAADPAHEAVRIYLSPKGKTLDQKTVTELAKLDHIVLINGSYEGIDERIIELDVDRELSIGDYVLTSGDLASLVVINAVARYIPDVLGSEQSTDEESFSAGTLEYPQYTRPQEFMGLRVPEVLLSGNHAEIAAWRRKESLRITAERRPDLLSEKDERK
ncbi:MAG: tRNA (guanosine(37)-N1)-methyltransferase TrmD [Firmicutes bacterium]|uniref:tRNA (guanine-N(1)-)-methyltransferase n=1 Tax=Candidatus Stercoripulliclostridium pullicola TaxID=2840953 RepID=A0A940ICI1_9FIRM|nr:tRNA (guanosine(37)-N1)-methyltransferase TrmD [Candidatus Stercoripulliclostridium pullicola]